MDYKKVYDQFISDRLNKQGFKGYAEKHHIIPKSLGGNNEPVNIIKLTASDHFFAHALLARIYKGKLVYALRQMLNFERRNSNKQIRLHYQFCKENLRHTSETKLKISGSLIGKTHSIEVRKKMSESRTGNKNHNFGKSMCKSTIEKLRSNRFNRQVLQMTILAIPIKIFKSISEASRLTNTPRVSIGRVCNGQLETSNNFKWEYVL